MITCFVDKIIIFFSEHFLYSELKSGSSYRTRCPVYLVFYQLFVQQKQYLKETLNANGLSIATLQSPPEIWEYLTIKNGVAFLNYIHLSQF